VVPEIARRAGLKPVFVDVDPLTFNLDPGKIEAAVTERTRVIVPTHLYGQPCEMSAIIKAAQAHDLIIIEDCAQAVGARYRGRLVGTFGTASFFSFQMLKRDQHLRRWHGADERSGVGSERAPTSLY